MAAVQRLRSSVRRINSCGRNRATTPTASNNDLHINVEEELSKLQPSQRLLDFYRQKIAKFDADRQHFLELLEKYQQTTKPTFLEEERRKLTCELIELRSALSDINVFIHAERQQVVRLHAENERLQVKCEEMITLRTHVKSLTTQLEESEKTWRRERNAFIQDRSLSTSESKAQAAKDEAHIKLLTARLEEAQRLLSESVKDTLNKNAEVQALEVTWLAERDHLLSVLATVQENIPLVSEMQAIDRSGSYTDLSTMKSTCVMKDLRRENELLKREAVEAEELRAMYESQCQQIEQKMCKLREQKEAAEQMFKERNQKLLQQIEMLKQDIKRLEERRRTDVQGFQSDIRLLKNDVKTVVHQLYKITMALSGVDDVPVDISALTEMQAVATLVRSVQRTVAETKRKIMRLENDINNHTD
ncbi:coiled-coil domain-containing protein 77 [Cherax quadricarinatus]